MSDEILAMLAAMRAEAAIRDTAVRDDLAAIRSEMATQTDIRDLRTEIDGVRTEMATRKHIGDMMARMDGHADELTQIRRTITVALGLVAQQHQTDTKTRSDIDYLLGHIVELEVQIQMLQVAVKDLKGP